MKTEYIKDKNSSKEYIWQTFNSMLDMYDYIIASDYQKYTKLLSEIKSDPKFYGSKSFDQALKELQIGRSDVTAKYMDAIKETSSIKAQVELQDFSMSEQGSIYDIGSVIAGVPECCIEDVPLPKIKKKLTIYLDMGYCGGTNSNYIDNRGIAVYNFVNSLLRENYIVDIYLLTHTIYNNNDDYNGIQLTKVTNINNKPLLPHLAFGCSTAYFRAINWMVMQLPLKDYNGSKTWQRAKSQIPKYMRDDFLKDNIFYIGGGYTNYKFTRTDTVEKAEKEIIRLFKEFTDGKDGNENY